MDDIRENIDVEQIREYIGIDVTDEVQMEVWINFLDSDTLKDSVMRGFEEYVES